MSRLSEPHFHNEAAAYAHLEALLWPNGPVCPHCGNAAGRIALNPCDAPPQGALRTSSSRDS